MAHLITFDIQQESDRTSLIEAIENLDNWTKLSESTYAVECDMNAGEIFCLLDSHIDDGNRLFVIELAYEFAGRGLKDVFDWLEQHTDQTVIGE